MSYILRTILIFTSLLLANVAYACWGTIPKPFINQDVKNFALKLSCLDKSVTVNLGNKSIKNLKPGDSFQIQTAKGQFKQAKVLELIKQPNGAYKVRLDYPPAQECLY